MSKRPKVKEVSKFGGAEGFGRVQANDNTHDLTSIEVKSKTHLEDDQGGGGAAIIRMFEFGINPQAFKEMKPTLQELFNAHFKGIEVALWKDGLKVLPEVNPRIVLDERAMTYRIFVGAEPMRGHILREQPKTLTELVHGGQTN